MTEADAVAGVERPATRATLAADLRSLGVEPGQVLVVHSSLSRLGWVAGGAQAVVLAVLDALGDDGTLVMPTHSPFGEPSRWQHPPVPEPWWQVIRDETPAFDPALTPTRQMGAIVECFRHVPGVLRSHHPASSFAAVGPHAATITAGHELAFGLGEGSPLARLYELDARVLLLGVGHGNNTSLHLAEHRVHPPVCETYEEGAPLLVDGARRWVTYPELAIDESDFEELGAAFAATGGERVGPVGAGQGRLVRQRDVVDFAVKWLVTHRAPVRSGPT